MEEQGAATQRDRAQRPGGGPGHRSGDRRCIDSVKHGAGETGAAAVQVLDAAQELARYAENLSREVDVFLSDVKAA